MLKPSVQSAVTVTGPSPPLLAVTKPKRRGLIIPQCFTRIRSVRHYCNYILFAHTAILYSVPKSYFMSSYNLLGTLERAELTSAPLHCTQQILPCRFYFLNQARVHSVNWGKENEMSTYAKEFWWNFICNQASKFIHSVYCLYFILKVNTNCKWLLHILINKYKIIDAIAAEMWNIVGLYTILAATSSLCVNIVLCSRPYHRLIIMWRIRKR